MPDSTLKMILRISVVGLVLMLAACGGQPATPVEVKPTEAAAATATLPPATPAPTPSPTGPAATPETAGAELPELSPLPEAMTLNAEDQAKFEAEIEKMAGVFRLTDHVGSAWLLPVETSWADVHSYYEAVFEEQDWQPTHSLVAQETKEEKATAKIFFDEKGRIFVLILAGQSLSRQNMLLILTGHLSEAEAATLAANLPRVEMPPAGPAPSPPPTPMGTD